MRFDYTSSHNDYGLELAYNERMSDDWPNVLETKVTPPFPISKIRKPATRSILKQYGDLFTAYVDSLMIAA